MHDWRKGERGCRCIPPQLTTVYSAHAQSWPAPISLQYRGTEPKQLNKPSLSAQRVTSGSAPSWCSHAISGQLSISAGCISSEGRPKADVFHASLLLSTLQSSSLWGLQGFHLHIYKTNWLFWFTKKIIFMMNKCKAASKCKMPQSICPYATWA